MLKQYLANAAKEYSLRLKTVVPLDDDAMDRIEMTVAKYLPLFISKPKKTIIQRQPLEFPAYQNAEIYIVNFRFGLPAAPHVIRDDIRKCLGAADEAVFVRTQNEPGEFEIERLNALTDIEVEAAEKGLTPAPFLSDADYQEIDQDEHDHSELFGNSYNAAFLSYLSAVQQERQAKVAQVSNAPFRWLGLADRYIADRETDVNVQDPTDFNAGIANAPRVAPQGVVTDDGSVRGSYGEFVLANGKQIRRLYVDDKGNRVVLARTLMGERT